jgi:hypothetical protein
MTRRTAISCLALFLSCVPQSHDPIHLPDRTQKKVERRAYDSCTHTYFQKTKYPIIEEKICVDSNDNHSVDYYFDIARNYPCSWHRTKDNKIRCIPAFFDDYYADLEWGWEWPSSPGGLINFEKPNQCTKRVVRLEIDPFHHPRTRYVGLEDRKGKFSVYEVGDMAEFSGAFGWHWSSEWEDWECGPLFVTSPVYPTLKKGTRWFFVGDEMDLETFQERD